MFISKLRNVLLGGYMRAPDHPLKLRIIRLISKYLLPARGIQATVYPGCYLYLHPRDYIEGLLLSGKRYEPLTLEFIQKNLSEGDSAILAGVNFGLHVIVAAQAVGESGNVVGVEPQPTALLRTEANLQLNGLSNRVSLVNIGLGSDEAFVKMAWADTEGNSGSASLLAEGRGFTIHLVKLETVLKQLTTKAPRLLLLDVEGYEFKVLEGLSVDVAPSIIVIEIQRELMKEANVSEDQLLDKLRSFGYALFTLEGRPVSESGAVIPESNLVGVRSGTNVVWLTISEQ